MDEVNGALGFKATIDDSDMTAAIKRIERNITGMSTQTVNETSKMDSAFKSLAIGIASAFTFDAALQLRQKLIDVRGQFQAFEAVLKNSLGSQEEASAAMQMLADTASKTPFQLDELTAAYVKLVNQGFKPTREEIVKLGDLASSTGKGFDQLAEAVIDAQTGQFERLKEFGIKASQSGDQVVFTFKGITTEVANTSDAIQKYLVGLGDMKGVQGAMEAISGTLVGQVSNLEDAITNMFNELGKSSEGFLSGTVSATKYLVDNYEQIGKILIQLVATYGAYKTAVIATTAVQAAAAAATKGWTIASQVQYTWLLLVEKAQKLLNATMLTNPYVLAATAIMSAVAALVLFNRNTEQVSERQEKLKSITEDYNKKLAEEKGKLLELTETAKNEAKSKDQRIKALNELKSLSGGYLNSLSLENIATAQGAKLLKDYNEQLEKKIVSEAFADQKTELYKQKAGYLITIQKAQTELDKLKKDFANDNRLNIELVVLGKDITQSALDAVDNQISELDKTAEQVLSKYKNTPTVTGTGQGSGTTNKAPELDFSQWDEAINEQVSLIDAQVAAMAESEVDALTDKAQKYIDEFNKLQELIQRAVDNSNSLDDNIRNINADYDAQISALGKSGLTESDIQQRTDALNKARQEDIDSAKDAAFQESEIYKKLNEEVVESYRRSLKRKIELIKSALQDTSKLSEEEINKLNNQLKQLQTALGNDTYQQIADGIQIAVSAINELTDSINGLNDKTKESIASLTDLASTGADFFSAMASGNMTQAASSALSYEIKLYTDLFKMAKDFYQLAKNGETDWQKEERLKKEFDDIKASIEQANAKLELFFYLINNSLATDKIIENYKNVFSSIRADLAAVINDIETQSGIDFVNHATGKDFSAIKEWIQSNQDAVAELYDKINSGDYTGVELDKLKSELEQYEKLTSEYLDAYSKYQELLTGSTYESVLSSLVQAFKDGKSSAADFADTFQELMQNALVQSFMMNSLEEPLQAWMDSFTNFSSGGLTQDEIDALSETFNNLIGNAGEAWKLIQENFPDLFGQITGGTTELTGAIKGITEETASLIAGQFNAVKMYTADILGVARESLAIQGKIEGHTSRLHNIERILYSMKYKGAQLVNPNDSMI